MSFGSIGFLLFIIAVFLIYWGVPHKFRWVLLLIANTFFYVCFDVRYLFVLYGVIIVSYFTALFLDKTENCNRQSTKWIFIIGVVLSVLPLIIFKYFNFAFYSVRKVLSLVAIPVDEFTLKLIMPVGISFFTFEAISYVCDVKNGKISAEHNFLKYALYVSFFPNITSGPIERAGNFLPQIDKEKTFDYDSTVYGLRLILLGMLKKYVCGDMMVKYIANVFNNVSLHSGTTFIVAIFMYTFEIYFDFSGYTDMARGIAGILGFDLSENFNAPYFARSIKEFWSRWHISLSHWLRDYIYIPLGGNRCSKARKNLNLLITFFVSGLWHGASFTFIVWGLFHGVCQCLEGLIPAYNRKEEKESGKHIIFDGIRMLITFCLVAFGWMFFRANSLSDAFYITRNMFNGGSFLYACQSMGMTKGSILKVAFSILFVALYDFCSKDRDLLKEMSKLKLPLRWMIYIIVTVVVIVIKVHEGTNASFIYFSF